MALGSLAFGYSMVTARDALSSYTRPASSIAVTRAVVSMVAKTSRREISATRASPSFTSAAAKRNASMLLYPYQRWPAKPPSAPGVYFMYKGFNDAYPLASVAMAYPRCAWSARISPLCPM